MSLSDLESFTDPTRDLKADDLTDLRRKLGAFRAALENARQHGINAQGDGSRTLVDAQVFAAIEKALARYETRLDGHLEKFFTKTLRRHADTMRVPYEDWFRSLPAEIQASGKEYGVFVARFQEWRSRLGVCIEKGDVAGVDGILAELKKMDETVYMQILPSLKGTVDEYAGTYQGKPDPKAPSADVVRIGFMATLSGLAHVVEALRDRLVRKDEILDKLAVTGADCRKLMEDRLSIDDRLEAHVFGYDDTVIDTEVSDRQPTEMRPLGSGASSRTFLCAFAGPEGTAPERRVFKPENSSWGGLKRGVNADFTVYGDFQRALDFNLATHNTAVRMGLGERCTEAKIGHLDGETGMFLEVAPGKSFLGLQKSPDLKPEGGLSGAEITALLASDPEKRRKVRGEVARQLNQLQWLDVINAQLDRHLDNVFLSVTEEGDVRVTGIDNDSCMGEKVFGVGKYEVSEAVHNKLKSRVSFLFQKHPDPEKAANVLKDLSDKGVIVALPDGGAKVDFALLPGELKDVFGQETGARSPAVPSCMDGDVYRGILDNSGENIGKYAESLDKLHLTEAQKKSAIARMQEARRIADQMMADGKVYERENWQDEGVQRILLSPSPKAPLLMDSKPESEAVKDIKDDYFRRPKVIDLLGG